MRMSTIDMGRTEINPTLLKVIAPISAPVINIPKMRRCNLSFKLLNWT